MAEKKINGETYRVEPLVASEALLLWGRIIEAMGPGIGHLPVIIEALGDGDDGLAVADMAALAAISDVVSRNTPEKIRDLIADIVNIASVLEDDKRNYRPVDMDVDFTGNTKGIVPLTKFVLEEQFHDFFTASVGSGLINLMAEAFQGVKLRR